MKLVRDLIPQIIEQSGKKPRYYAADLPEFKQRLYDKMQEEMQEFREDPCVEEAADMLEVLRGICWINKISMREVSEAAQEKARLRGGFTSGYVLENVEDHDEDDWTVTPYGEQNE